MLLCVQMDMRMEQLRHEARALASSKTNFRGFMDAQDHILLIPEQIVNPLKRTSEEISLLRTQADKMESIQVALDEDAREFKRSKAEGRAAFCTCRRWLLLFGLT